MQWNRIRRAKLHEGRNGAAVIDWLTARTREFRETVQFVAIDSAAVYASAIRASGCCQTRRS